MNSSCPWCKEPSGLSFRSKDYNRRITDEIFDFYCCPSCKLIFLSPIPSELSKYYPNTYHSFPNSYEQLAATAQRERYKIDIVKKFSSKGRLLEIGPSYGGFAFLAKQAGFEVEVLEMDSICCKYIEDIVGIKAINSSNPSEVLRGAGQYDVVVLWHVLEHLIDPMMTLRTIAELLLPRGILIVATPNPDSLQFRILGHFWPHIDAPRHLTLIPLSLLQKETGTLGLTPIWATTTDKGTLDNNTFGWEVFFSNFVRRGFFRKNFQRIGWVVSMLMAPAERISGLGSAYTAVFRKES